MSYCIPSIENTTCFNISKPISYFIWSIYFSFSYVIPYTPSVSRYLIGSRAHHHPQKVGQGTYEIGISPISYGLHRLLEMVCPARLTFKIVTDQAWHWIIMHIILSNVFLAIQHLPIVYMWLPYISNSINTICFI